ARELRGADPAQADRDARRGGGGRPVPGFGGRLLRHGPGHSRERWVVHVRALKISGVAGTRSRSRGAIGGTVWRRASEAKHGGGAGGRSAQLPAGPIEEEGARS